jgi:FkbM family methyltransferase
LNLHNIVYDLIQYIYSNKFLISIIVKINLFISKLNLIVNANKFIFSVKTIDRIVYVVLIKLGVWDKELIAFVDRTVKKNMVVVDVGANIGVYTLMFSKLVGERGSVISIEADKDNYEILENNISLNKCNNISAYYTAIFSEVTEKKFIVNKIHKGDHRLIQDKDKANEEAEYVLVKCSTLDSILQNNEIDIIKIDIQGGELDALEGMKNVIGNSPNLMIIMEYDLSYAFDTQKRFEEFCQSNQFKVNKIEKNSLKNIPKIRQLAEEKEKYFNIVLTRK